MEQKQAKKNNFTLLLIMTMVFIVVTAIVGIIVFRIYIGNFRQTGDTKTYSRYYVMIVDDRKDSFWQAVYQGAYEAGQKENIYVELLGENLSRDYEKTDLMRIAIASDVDGIIVVADESDLMTELIDEAAAEGIPVVTLYSDNTKSKRCSYVGIGSYNLGREYGRQVLQIEESRKSRKESADGGSEDGTDGSPANTEESNDPLKVTVLVNAHAEDSLQNILCSGIQETIDMEKGDDTRIEMTLVSVDESNAFSVEESIRDIFMTSDIPDIIVCLNELTTTCAYQTVVDYNRVGQVDILGYYDSETILKAIERNVIYATVSIDTMQMGRSCVDAISEYHALGNTSQYFTADISLVNKKNVSGYLEGGDTNEK
ncbi:MAG: substrate-binding domain-containing protein [Lachnospiraceae bacterium]|nr:substrate-binding domain-containing protein [Lachnospiraceae bacterium]